MEGSEAESCGEAFVPRHSCYPAVFTVLRVSPERVLVCFCFSTDLCALMPGKNSFLSVNLLKILKPLCGLSVRVDFLFWELCFNVLAIFFFLPPPTSHTIAIFPSFLYLFSHPRFPEIVQRRRLYILFSYCDTWRAFCDYQFRSCRSSMLCVFLGGFIWEKCWKFSQLLFSICASVCVFCVVPHFHLTRNISSFFSLHVFHISMKKNKSFFVTDGEYVCGSMKGFLIEQR